MVCFREVGKKMRVIKKILFSARLSLALMILLTGFAFGQSNQAANKSWSSFWTKFKTAVNTKNRNSLISLTSKKFFSPSGETISELLKNNDWRWLKNSVKTGTKPHTCRKVICRRTRNAILESSLVFVFENNRWSFIGQLGE